MQNAHIVAYQEYGVYKYSLRIYSRSYLNIIQDPKVNKREGTQIVGSATESRMKEY